MGRSLGPRCAVGACSIAVAVSDARAESILTISAGTPNLPAFFRDFFLLNENLQFANMQSLYIPFFLNNFTIKPT